MSESTALTAHLSVRQWVVFPSVFKPQFATVRLRNFRILIETTGGQIVFARMKSRLPPDRAFIDHIGTVLDRGNPYGDRDQSDGYLYDLDSNLSLLNCPIDADKSWLTPTIIAESVLDETLVQLQQGRHVGTSLRTEWAARLKDNIHEAVTSFVARLDQPLVMASRNSEGQYCRPSTYNFLIAKDAREPHAKRNRLQAVGLFPFLLPMLPIDRRLWSIELAIDNGRPLVEALANFFSIPPAVVKSLRHQSGSIIGPQWANRPAVLLQVLAMLPPNGRPRAPEAWELFNKTSRLIEEKSGSLSLTFSQLWLRAAMAQGCRTLDIRETEMETAAYDIDDLCTQLEDVLNFQISGSGLAASHAVRSVVTEMKTSHNPIRLARIAQKWRRTYIRFRHAFADDKELWIGVRWKALLEEPFEGTSHSIVALTDFAALRAEGMRMSNCVEIYADKCRRGESQIWSCRSQEGESCSTVETVILDQAGKFSVKVIQQKGPKNYRASDSCREIASALMKYLEKQQDQLAAYVVWRNTIASRPMDERAMIAFFSPIISALEATLPKQWTLAIMRSKALERLKQESSARVFCHSTTYK